MAEFFDLMFKIAVTVCLFLITVNLVVLIHSTTEIPKDGQVCIVKDHSTYCGDPK